MCCSEAYRNGLDSGRLGWFSVGRFKYKPGDKPWWEIYFKTSLKIFKHYKLKPSFSIFKDDEAKDMIG